MAVEYVESGGVSLAYEVLSASGPDLILLPPIGNRAVARSVPAFEQYYDGISRYTRLVVYDRRGLGMSDVPPSPPTLEEHVADLEVVRRTVGAERVSLTSAHVGSLIVLAYALAYPENVDRIVLMNGVACDAADPESPPGGRPLLPWKRLEELGAANFDEFLGAFFRRATPRLDAGEFERMMLYYKASVTPRTFYTQLLFARGVDLRPRLAELAAPTLMIASRGDRFGAAAHGRYLAKHLPAARLVEIETEALIPWAEPESLGPIHRAYEEFLTGRVVHVARRVLATILFTDIVRSTSLQQKSGDRAWRLVRAAFEEETRREVEQFGGRVVQFLGDGVLAVFPVPSDALRTAQRLVDAARRQGIEIRAGLHTGEVESHGDEVSGICVNVAARVAARAGAEEILVTRTVRDVVEGTGFRFTDVGDVELKDVGSRALSRLVAI